MLRSDRGRIVTAMDGELLRLVCRAVPCDGLRLHANSTRSAGTNIFWTLPVLEVPSEVDGILLRTAKVRMFFFAEVA